MKGSMDVKGMYALNMHRLIWIFFLIHYLISLPKAILQTLGLKCKIFFLQDEHHLLIEIFWQPNNFFSWLVIDQTAKM